MKLETIEHARFRALSQLIVDQEKGVNAFEEYMKIAFPYLETAKLRDKEKHLSVLKKEISKGPLAVKKLTQPTIKSKLKQRIVKNADTKNNNNDRLYKKLGDTLPI